MCQSQIYIIIVLNFIYIFTVTSTKWQNYESCGKVDANSALLGPGSVHGVRVPWTATFTIRSLTEEPDRTHAAIIISPNMVLTFANKLLVDGTNRFQIWNYSQYIVTVGSTKFGDPIQVDPTAKTVGITHISIHPSFEPGHWTIMKSDLALMHLKESFSFSEKIRPICIPDLDAIENPSSSENLILSGWNRGIIDNIFLRLSIKSREKCEQLWKINVTKEDPYENKFCGLVGYENNHSSCIHRGVVSARLINGSYNMAGAISNFFGLTDPSGEESRTCDPNTLYYFDSYLNDGSYDWIASSEICGPNSFTCHNGQCVNLTHVCDKKQDCSDGSDEESKFCRGLNFCKDGTFACGVYDKCIPNGNVNDGVKDCENGEDEMFTEIDNPNKVWIWMGVSGAVLLVVGISLFAYIWILRNKIRDLTQEEIDEFFSGSMPEPPDRNFEDSSSLDYIHKPHSGPTYVNDYIQVMPWALDNEIHLQDIEFLGEINRGNFGIIHKARILHNDTITHDLVAAKTHKSNVCVEDFKMLLCELKILAYVGCHDNIISFIGACTENIKKRSVYLVMEYCALGDLRNYLTNNSIGFENLLTPNKACTTYYVQLSTFDTVERSSKLNSLDLIKWSSQIARGMEHLASKKIIHGDLSTRNILLTNSKDCKICDFGLSHRLGRSGVYVKTSLDSIPWKWMSLETLQYNWFTELSDVWSLGITLWEVFNLGEVPYKRREFSRVFVQELLAGYRLPCPNYANEEIYNLMMSCWEEKAEHRPTMGTINHFFENIFESYKAHDIEIHSSESTA